MMKKRSRLKDWCLNIFYKILMIKKYAWTFMFTKFILWRQGVLLEVFENERRKAERRLRAQKPLEFEYRDIPIVGERLERQKELIDRELRSRDAALVRAIFRE